jgi:hypothetical protein
VASANLDDRTAAWEGQEEVPDIRSFDSATGQAQNIIQHLGSFEFAIGATHTRALAGCLLEKQVEDAL